MSLSGLVNINFMIKNTLESLNLTTTVTVSNLNCQRPILNIKNLASDFLNPLIFQRSKMFSVVSITKLDCAPTLINKKQWVIYEVNATNGSVIQLTNTKRVNNKTVLIFTMKTINLTTIVSSIGAEIYIPSNFLPYGTYKFVYQVTMNDDLFVDSIETYIRIVPTGISINPFSGSMKEITVFSPLFSPHTHLTY